MHIITHKLTSENKYIPFYEKRINQKEILQKDKKLISNNNLAKKFTKT